MPSPVGHALGGLIVAELLGGSMRRVPVVVLACAPDLDVFAGLLDGDPSGKHARATHSLSAAALVAVGAGAVGALRGHRFVRWGGTALAAYGSHLLLDYLGKESESGEGMELYWPFSHRRAASERGWFPTFTSKSKGRGFWRGLLSWHNARTVAHEVLMLGPPALLAHRLRT